MRYDVPLIGQTDPDTCWAAAFAMILSWAEGRPVSPETIIVETGHAYRPGIGAEERFPFDHYGFEIEQPRSWTTEGFARLLETYGPLWAAVAPDINDDGVADPHVVVVTGMDPGPSAEAARVWINDPWDWDARRFRRGAAGCRYDVSFRAFFEMFQDPLAETDRTLLLTDAIYLAHLRVKPRWG